MATKTRIDDLELVVALSEERTLSQVAKRVGMTQPAISKRLQVIQRRLQLKLFETNHTGADITEPGRFFAEYAQQSVNLFHRGIHEARQAKDAHLNRLRVGTQWCVATDHYLQAYCRCFFSIFSSISWVSSAQRRICSTASLMSAFSIL